MDSYKMIRQQIIDDIERGIYEPGDTIPKQVEFAEKYGVSRGTIRKAFNELIQRGVLVTTKGRGTIVANYKMSRQESYRPLSFSASKRVKEKKLHSKLIDLKELNAEPWLAKQLFISVGSPVIFIKRVRIVEDNPENYQFSYISKTKFGSLDPGSLDLENNSLFEYISQETGLYAMMKDEEIRAVHCPEDVARELKMQVNDPILLIMRTVYGQDNLPLEYCEDYECTDIKGLKITTRGNIEKEVFIENEGENREDT